MTTSVSVNTGSRPQNWKGENKIESSRHDKNYRIKETIVHICKFFASSREMDHVVVYLVVSLTVQGQAGTSS